MYLWVSYYFFAHCARPLIARQMIFTVGACVSNPYLIHGLTSIAAPETTSNISQPDLTLVPSSRVFLALFYFHFPLLRFQPSLSLSAATASEFLTSIPISRFSDRRAIFSIPSVCSPPHVLSFPKIFHNNFTFPTQHDAYLTITQRSFPTINVQRAFIPVHRLHRR